MSDLKPCPCGAFPKKLLISESSSGYRWGVVAGDCCGDWETEFRTRGHELETDECTKLAVEYWNEAKRNKRSDGWISVSDRLPDKNNRVFYWVDPKPPEECPHDTSGNPIISYSKEGHFHEGKYGTWSCLYKPTHWMPIPNKPGES